MQEDNDLVQEFLVESAEGLDQLDSDLLALEESPDSEEVVARIFRTVHSIKGTCGFLGFEKLESVTHVGENLLSRVRDGELRYDQAIADGLLRMVDAVRGMLAQVQETGSDGEEDFRDLIAVLEGLLEDGGTREAPAREGRAEATDGEGDEESAGSRLGQVLQDLGHVDEETLNAALDLQRTRYPGEPLGKILAELGVVEQKTVDDALSQQTESRSTRQAGESIRVQVEQLDKLMNLVGELVLTRNQILLASDASDDPTTYATTQRLNVITSELQEGVMQIRMQPIGNMWSKLPRVVRDVSRTLGKKVRIQMDGRETELDKTLLEAIKDPFTHIIRNSVDHGIETPEVRAAQGKAPEGTILLRAYHESGQVNIEISDDGAGLDLERIRQKVVENGLMSHAEAADLGDRALANMIFSPGLSTAREVTNVSGRGVGMDVVRTNIERIGGSIDVSSVRGRGTTLRIKIPLTLAIIPALIVTCRNERFAIPQANLVELVRIEGEAVRDSMEQVHGVPVYRLRGALLPLVDLAERLRLPAAGPAEDPAAINIVVVHADGRSFGMVVDEIDDTEEIVVKPLHSQLKGTEAFAGSTIMGDGRVALILDVIGLATSSGVVSRDDEVVLQDASEDSVQDSRSFLVVRLGGAHNVAVPLGSVSRLEDVELDRIEYVGDQEVIQYRGEIMPLIRLSRALGLPSTASTEHAGRPRVMPTVVHRVGGRSVGLLVDEIHDIVESAAPVDLAARRTGTTGSVVMDGRVTELVDLDWLLSSQAPSFAAAVEGREEVEVEPWMEEAEACGGARLLCTFHVDGQYFGVDVQHVQEILRWQNVTPIPTTSRVVEGLINLRGQTVLALDLRHRLGLRPRTAAAQEMAEECRPMSVVVRTPEGVVSLIVDDVGDVLEVEEEKHEEPPRGLPAAVEGLITDVFKLEGRLLLCLDVQQTARGEFAEAGA